MPTRNALFAVTIGLVVIFLTLSVGTSCGLGTVNSTSMSPIIKQNDLFIVAPPIDLIERGDIIVYRTLIGELVTHRVIGITSNGYITKGDSNTHTDQEVGRPPIPRSAVVGEVFLIP